MNEFLVRSLHLRQDEVQKVISLLDMYIDIAVENKPDETEVENLTDVLMDICKRVFQTRYAAEDAQ